MSGSAFSADAIRAAHADVPLEFRGTPQFESEVLGARAGGRIVVKVETLNPIRSFKGRGTWVAVSALVAAGRATPTRGVATITTGNFGQGVAYAARGHGLPAVIVLPKGANPAKVATIRRLGARIVEVAQGADGEAVLDQLAEREGLVVLRDGHDDRIAIGAGTMALEVTDAVDRGVLPAIDAAYVPIGDGSLIAGVGIWLRATSPATRVIGVQVDGAPAMARSWRTGRVEVVPPLPSRADGLASGTGNADLLAILRDVVDDMVLVRESDLLAAQHEVLGALGVAAEASGAASWLAAREAAGGGATGRGATSLVIVTGSNAWPTDFDPGAR